MAHPYGASGTFRGPRSPIFRAALLYFDLRVRSLFQPVEPVKIIFGGAEGARTLDILLAKQVL